MPDLPSDQKISLTASLNNLIDLFKKITIKIKENNKSVVDQVNEIERNIKSYQDKVSKSESNLIQYEQKQKDYEIYKNKLEKEKIDLKQSHDKYNWQYNEAAENLNINNVTSSTLKDTNCFK